MNPSNIPRAEVYDLGNISKPPPFRYFLDTNILKFVFARTPFIRDNGYQLEYYPQFFRALTQTKRIKFTLTQNMLELMTVMDRIEEEHLQANIKSYRQDNLEQYLLSRQAIFEEVQKSLDLLTIRIEIDSIAEYFKIDYSIDLNDFVFHRLVQSNDTAIVTDDLEFIFAPDIRVFTANHNAI